jgi:hypothetical protein
MVQDAASNGGVSVLIYSANKNRGSITRTFINVTTHLYKYNKTKSVRSNFVRIEKCVVYSTSKVYLHSL